VTGREAHESGTPVVPVADATPAGFDDVRFGLDGLVTAIVQDATSHEVLMVAHMNEESLRRTLEDKRTWFWSRSRRELWPKGETSGNRQRVRGVLVDCDGDALVIEVDQQGSGACHTGARTCFMRRLAG
jgi:phosphoribosyl-AMP cyclohydrolase